MKTNKVLFVLLTVLIILTGCSKANKISLMHIHGLGFSNDGKQLIMPAHDGLVVYTDGKWSTMEGKKHDYMGFNIVDNGFYSSGHPATDSGLKNPLGIVKSTDNGKTLQHLDLYGIEDFHTMAVGFKSHSVYVFNKKPNAKMDSTGLYYSTDDTKTWNKCEMNGLSDEPITIAVHPSNSAIVAIGTKEGLFLSKDFGNHFEVSPKISLSTALAYGEQGNLLIGGKDTIEEQNGNKSISIKIPALDQNDAVTYIAQNPVNQNEIVYATLKKSVYRSTDKGATWNEMIHLGDVIIHDSKMETPAASINPPLLSNVKTTDCTSLVIPNNKELNTNLDRENEIIEVSWYDDTKGADVAYRIKYTDTHCSESVIQLIKHVLNS